MIQDFVYILYDGNQAEIGILAVMVKLVNLGVGLLKEKIYNECIFVLFKHVNISLALFSLKKTKKTSSRLDHSLRNDSKISQLGNPFSKSKLCYPNGIFLLALF